MECFRRVSLTVRRVWIHFSARLGLRRTTGLRKLRKEVSACEYEDVHVMWEMLQRSNEASSRTRQRHGLPLLRWAAPYCLCHAF